MVCYSVSDCRGKSTSKETTNEALHAAGVLAWSITKFGVVLDRSSLWLEDSQALECIQYADLFVHLYLHEASRALQEKRSGPSGTVFTVRSLSVCETETR